ncbi:3-deoxy-D-manno-octulosonic acid transferase [Extensimonas perlucida]|uniref:3-deoxy-D-manno-octulosonic acid transferase n=1 Tax=Extensimonas perlucida TaxID=2590786 RepID=UPI001FE903DE|nr:3-deoxy-D-manno-octulosonic acid transferase [Extensimonas perlucida]
MEPATTSVPHPVMAWLALRLYAALTWLAQPLLRRKLRRRARAEPGYAQAVGERFGRYAPEVLRPLRQAEPAHADAPWVWVHAVSLGETRAAAILIAALRARLPGMRLLLTHGTATGRAEGAKLLQPGDVQVWQPWDTRAAVGRFLRTFRPALGILMETEVWPNLVAGCKALGVPLVLANARFNETSWRRARRLRALAVPAYRSLTAVWAQTEDDARRLRSLGAPVQAVLGNLKFDLRPDAAQLALGQAWRAHSPRPVVMLASSREGEEAMWLQAVAPIFERKCHLAQVYQAQAAIDSEVSAQASGPSDHAAQVQWLIVPRHPQRFDEVAALMQSSGLSVARRSSWTDAPVPADVWLGDSLGEMQAYYALADVALLGGSFAPLGGQNLIEAAACGCPVVLGPHTFNFAEAAQCACEAGAALRVADLRQGVQAACALALDGARLAQARVQAQAFAQTHRGAADATAQAVAALLAQLGRGGDVA